MTIKFCLWCAQLGGFPLGVQKGPYYSAASWKAAFYAPYMQVSKGNIKLQDWGEQVAVPGRNKKELCLSRGAVSISFQPRGDTHLFTEMIGVKKTIPKRRQRGRGQIQNTRSFTSFSFHRSYKSAKKGDAFFSCLALLKNHQPLLWDGLREVLHQKQYLREQ